MCGIVGFNWEEKDLLRRMTTILSHRGPDGSGTYANKGISLGHRRLAIIDLSRAGKQPMCDSTERFWITYNGEIYNFRELRKELENKGHRFISQTDTEVLLYGYKEWGKEILQRVNGMFAFAIWDEEEKELFLARDRLGIKPLFYYWDGKKFIFASEIKAILLDPEVERSVNRRAAHGYFNLRYVHGEETLFTGIRKLLPGQILTLKGKKLSTQPFWDLPLRNTRKPTRQKAAQSILNLLQDAVEKRLLADVPVGAYLSGGIDSAAIVALATALKQKAEKEPLKTFSVGFDYNNKVDELHKARRISEAFNTDHHEIIVNDTIRDILPRIIWHLDMPHGDPVVIPMFKLSKAARKKVTVVLSGEGADETFGGYVQYKTMLQAWKARYIPRAVRKSVTQAMPVALLDRFFSYPESIGKKGKEKALDFVNNLHNSEQGYNDLVSIMSNKDRQKLLVQHHNTFYDPFALSKEKHLLNRMLHYDTKSWLPNYVLHINDRMTMANSIEGRVPFLDHRLVEYASILHPKLKIRRGMNKAILRQALQQPPRPILPQAVTATKKHAFFMPLDRWVKEELEDLAEQVFTERNVKQRGYFNYYHLQKIWHNYQHSKLLYGKQLFTVLNFELWHRMMIDADRVRKTNKVKMGDLL